MKVVGNPDAPLYHSYTCPKGRALPEQHCDSGRLLNSLKRQANGSHQPISSDALMDEVSAKLQDLIARHGPRSVAMYMGTGSVPHPAAVSMGSAWLKAIGSRMHFSAVTIDKPGILIALALHGSWAAGQPPFDAADSWIVVGANPVISKGAGFPAHNPGLMLKRAAERGMKLVVIDPRRTETARRADLFLQPRPGHDPEILAAMIHVILAEQLHDDAFVAEHAAGLEALRQAVAAFGPATVAMRADVPSEQIVEAARLFAGGKHSGISCGTGPSFATHGTLTEYLALCLLTLCGRWTKAGEKVAKPNVLLPAYVAKAQAMAPYQAWGYGERLRVRGLGSSASGLATAALADEILLPGDGQVRALICVGGNPMTAFPDQKKTFAALSGLELLVSLDCEMTATARLSHYVVAPKLSLETPGSTYGLESLKYLGTNRGMEQPFAAYAPRVVDPPRGSDVIEEWEFFFGLARRMGLQLQPGNAFGVGRHREASPDRQALDMSRKPTSDEMLELSVRRSRVPLDEVKKYPHGHIFPVEEFAQPRDPSHAERLDLAATSMLKDLRKIAAHPTETSSDFPFRLTPRRMNQFINSWGRTLPKLAGTKPYNPAFMHPDDLRKLGISPGDLVTIRSAHDEVLGIVDADPGLRPGVVSMSHGFGDNPDVPADPFRSGASASRLVSVEDNYDPVSGIPRMGALPVQVRAAERSTPR